MTNLVLASDELSADLKFTFVLWSYSPPTCPPTSTYISEYLVLLVVFTCPNEYTKKLVRKIDAVIWASISILETRNCISSFFLGVK